MSVETFKIVNHYYMDKKKMEGTLNVMRVIIEDIEDSIDIIKTGENQYFDSYTHTHTHDKQTK